MRKWAVLVMVGVMVCAAVSMAQAQQRYPLGNGNVAFKVDYLRFTDDGVKNLDAENGIYIAGEFYVPVFNPNLYLGLEVGYGWSSGDIDIIGADVDVDLDYVPIEFNGKYAFELDPSLVLSLGAGISYNYLNIDADVNGISAGDSDWLFGGQFFADLNYKMGQWFAGANVKYQITEDTTLGDIEKDASASNFRAGGQFGFMF